MCKVLNNKSIPLGMLSIGNTWNIGSHKSAGLGGHSEYAGRNITLISRTKLIYILVTKLVIV